MKKNSKKMNWRNNKNIRQWLMRWYNLDLNKKIREIEQKSNELPRKNQNKARLLNPICKVLIMQRKYKK